MSAAELNQQVEQLLRARHGVQFATLCVTALRPSAHAVVSRVEIPTAPEAR